MEMLPRRVPRKPYSLRELGKLYGVCARTLKKWLEPIEAEVGPRRGRFYTINQVELIFEKLGEPESGIKPS